MTTIRISKRCRVIFDQSQVFPDDPGAGTPALVCLRVKNNRFSFNNEVTATLNCAIGENEVDGYPLTDDEWEALAKLNPHDYLKNY